MYCLARYCRSSALLPQVKNLLKNPSQNSCLVRNNALRSYVNITQSSKNGLKVKFFNLGRNNTRNTLVRFCSNAPKKSNKPVGYWLMTCGGMVFVAIVLGGITRLTESGLSMVHWKMFGEKMPRTEKEWEEEFKKYQQFPEYKYKNSEMTLSEFKWIWHMEYGHRMWGRAIGAVFLIPGTYFWATGHFNSGMKKRALIFGALIATQGLMGWYMVQSGLEDRFHKETDVPRVSQYRLAAHLGLALFLYTSFLWSGLHHLLPAEKLVYQSKKALKSAKNFRWIAYGSKGVFFLTALSGAFVAGLDAGLVYNSFPKFADKWIPDDILAFTPKMINFTENPTTVQFNHRILGTTVLAYATFMYLISRKRILPRRAHAAAAIVATVAWLQVGLGITALLTYVPTAIAACHQSGAITLLSTSIWLSHELKKLPK